MFEIFKEDDESFTSYKERLENFFEMRNAPPAKKPLVLINSIEAKFYQLLSNATSPEKPNSKSYEELIGKLEEILCPEKNEVSEQHKFGMVKQTDGQSITTFVAELKKAALFCNFKCESCLISTLNSHLRFQFIIGLRDSVIRERLLLEKNISFENAVKMASSIESSKNNCRLIQVLESKIEPIFQQAVKPRAHNSHFVCYKCGVTGHKSNECKAKNLHCSKCKKIGHVEKVCKSVVNLHSCD